MSLYEHNMQRRAQNERYFLCEGKTPWLELLIEGAQL
jgi:hypothetical protein